MPAPTGVNYAGATGFTTAAGGSSSGDIAVFIPELWSDEIIASYKSNLVLAPLSVTMNHVGKKGDTVRIPKPIRAAANQKVETETVNIISNTEPDRTFVIDQHWEYSRLIEDFAAIQAIDSYRQFYTDDAGYSLATRVDTELHGEGGFFNAAGVGTETDVTEPASSQYDGSVIGSGLTQWDDAGSGNGAALTDAGIRLHVQTLDDNDAPSVRRQFIIPPVEKRKLNGEDEFRRYDALGEGGSSNTVRNGLVGDLYGAGVYVSTNANTVTSVGDSTPYRQVLYFQREALVYLEQLGMRSQEQYKQEYLATLFTSDIIFGTGVLRPEAGLSIFVPA